MLLLKRDLNWLKLATGSGYIYSRDPSNHLSAPSNHLTHSNESSAVRGARAKAQASNGAEATTVKAGGVRPEVKATVMKPEENANSLKS